MKAELLNADGTPGLQELDNFFSFITNQVITPQAWSESAIIVFFEKGDKTLLSNYKPSSRQPRLQIVFKSRYEPTC